VTDRILLIEDDARLAEMVQNYLGESGFSVTIAPTGRAGLALHDRQEFEALILDLMLPDKVLLRRTLMRSPPLLPSLHNPLHQPLARDPINGRFAVKELGCQGNVS
jgi:CheY-like chemotaxis protein